MGIENWKIDGNSSILKLLIVGAYEALFGKNMNKSTDDEPPLKLSEEEELERLKEFEDKKEKYYFCKVCGRTVLPPENIKDFYWNFAKCRFCGSIDSYIPSKYDQYDYVGRASEILGDCAKYKTVLLIEEIEPNPEFDREKYKAKCAREIEIRNEMNELYKRGERIRQDSSVPKCPTCQSTRIEKISISKKVVGAATLGYYSKNAMCQFVCNNCGYKW